MLRADSLQVGEGNDRIRIEPGRFALSLMLAAVVLVIAHVTGAIASHVFHHQQVFGLVDTFDMNVENNVPTFFSAFILVTSAVLLTVITSRNDRRSPCSQLEMAGHHLRLHGNRRGCLAA